MFCASLLGSVVFVLRFVVGGVAAAGVAAVVVLTMTWLWIVVPVLDAGETDLPGPSGE